jgi:hypothetical protein
MVTRGRVEQEQQSGAFHLIIPGGLHVRCVEKTRDGEEKMGRRGDDDGDIG